LRHISHSGTSPFTRYTRSIFRIDYPKSKIDTFGDFGRCTLNTRTRTIGNTRFDAELNPLSNHVLKVALAPTYVRIWNSFGGRFKFLEVGFLDRSGRKNLKANIVPNFFAWLHTLDIPPTYHAQSAAINFLWSTRQVTKVADHHVSYLSFW
jgi:hypothetical protein